MKVNITTQSKHGQVVLDFAASKGISVQSADVTIDSSQITTFDFDETTQNIKEFSRDFANYFLDRAIPESHSHHYDGRETRFGSESFGFQVGKGQEEKTKQFVVVEQNPDSVDLIIRDLALEH